MAVDTILPRDEGAPDAPAFSLRNDLRAIKIMLFRELLRVFRNRSRITSTFTQPIFYLFILGTGLSSLIPSTGGANLRTFMFPGVISMTVLLTAMFAAGNLVWDREFGFMREMLVAPVSRPAIVLGKCLGGATLATMQGLVVICLAGLVHVPYAPTLLITLVGEVFLAAFALTSLGVLVAASMDDMQSFFALQQMAMMPMIFLSGTVFPVSGLPSWLAVLTRLDPLGYVVDLLRRTMFLYLHGSNRALADTMGPGISWFGWHLPLWFEVMMIGLSGLLLSSAAVLRFRRAG